MVTGPNIVEPGQMTFIITPKEFGNRMGKPGNPVTQALLNVDAWYLYGIVGVPIKLTNECIDDVRNLLRRLS